MCEKGATVFRCIDGKNVTKSFFLKMAKEVVECIVKHGEKFPHGLAFSNIKYHLSGIAPEGSGKVLTVICYKLWSFVGSSIWWQNISKMYFLTRRLEIRPGYLGRVSGQSEGEKETNSEEYR